MVSQCSDIFFDLICTPCNHNENTMNGEWHESERYPTVWIEDGARVEGDFEEIGKKRGAVIKL